jgi:hypothetical protein
MNEIIVKNSGIITLPRIVDDRDGILCIMEGNRDIPFDIKRVYYINNLDSVSSVRGKHAHRTLSQVIFCVNGSFTLALDDGCRQQDVHMWQSNVGILLGPMLWHTMYDFSGGCVILVAASDYYFEADYIRDYNEFTALAKE